MTEPRYYCPLQPCLPVPLDGTPVNDEIIRESRSFGEYGMYLWHIEHGHFIGRPAAPAPYERVR